MARHRQSERRLSGVVLGTAGDPSPTLETAGLRLVACGKKTAPKLYADKA